AQHGGPYDETAEGDGFKGRGQRADHLMVTIDNQQVQGAEYEEEEAENGYLGFQRGVEYVDETESGLKVHDLTTHLDGGEDDGHDEREDESDEQFTDSVECEENGR